jgi:hypothetical protein
MTLLSREYFEKYARSVGVTSDFDHAVILDDTIAVDHANGAKTIERATDLKAGDRATVVMRLADDSGTKNTEFTIAAVTDKKPMGSSELSKPSFFASEDYFERDKLIMAEGYVSLYMNPGDRSEDISDYLTSLLKDKYLDLKM